MKVLREGRSWILEHDCTGWGNGGKGCGALLGISREDLYYYKGVPGDSWGSRYPAVMFKCPCCGQITDLGRNDWPRSLNTLKTWTEDWMNA
jgi:hypothetical protein